MIVSQESNDTVGAPHAVSAEERIWYYNGVTDDGDQPELLYRTSSEKDPWVASTGRYAYPPIKFARPVHGTPLNRVWDTVGPLIDDLVCAAVKRCYSIDPVRFFTVPHGEDVKDGTLGSAVIWVTVNPDSNISVDTAHEVSQSVLQLLAVNDAQVEWCEGLTSKLSGPPLLPVVNKRDATAHVRRHLTAALGMPIAPAEMEEQDGQGSVGFFFHENIDKRGNPSDKVLAVTNHHVLCKIDDKMYDYRGNGSPRQQVRVCGTRRFQQGLDEIRAAVVNRGTEASVCAEEIAELEAKVAMGGGNEHDIDNLNKARGELGDHRAAIVELENLYNEIKASWGDIRLRNIGVLEYSPPISIDVNDRGYTEDWATIRLDEAKCRPNFVGNAIDLGAFLLPNIDHLVEKKTTLSGTAISASELTMLLYPRNDGNTTFKYPSDRLLRIRGVVTKEKLANPDTLDSEGQPSFVVMKDGCRTGLTVGRYAGLESFVHNENGLRSIELAIYNYDKQSRPFSAKGDSGSLIVNGKGEMVGVFHSGRLKRGMTATHVTYATPAWRLLEWIKAIYPNADFTRETW